jgi:hypothetical protein
MSNANASSGNGFFWLLILVAAGLGLYWFNDPQGFQKNIGGLFNSDPDVRMRKDIIGAWNCNEEEAVLHFSFKPDGTFTFSADGKGVKGLFIGFNNLIGAGELRGIWSIDKQVLTTELVGNSNAAAEAFVTLLESMEEYSTGKPVKKVARARINKLEGGTLALDNGRVMKRVK